jgi:hypothetical protein
MFFSLDFETLLHQLHRLTCTTPRFGGCSASGARFPDSPDEEDDEWRPRPATKYY